MSQVNSVRVSEIFKEESQRLSKDLVLKVKTDETEMYFKDLVDLAIEQGIFNPDEYHYTDDENYLYDLLTFSLGLSHLWTDYVKENPDAKAIEVNRILVTYMINMFGLEKVTIREKTEIETILFGEGDK